MNKDFQKLTNTKKKIFDLIVGSCNASGSYEVWKKVRQFTSKEFTKDGTILDIGCANGFFLRCLQEWSGHKLIPYGIDIEKKAIAVAKQLFPQNENNFVVFDALKLSEFKSMGFPKEFDYVYTFPLDKENFEIAYNMVAGNGKIIVAFYGSNKHKIGSQAHEKERNQLTERIRHFQSEVMKFDRIIANPKKTNHIIGIIKK